MSPTSPRTLAAVSTPQPGSSSNCGALELTSTASSRSSSRTRVLRSARARRLESPLKPDLSVKTARGQLELEPHVVQMPARPALIVRARSDEIVVMVQQQLDLKRLLVDAGLGKPIGSLRERRPGDRQRIDRIGLPRACAPLRKALICDKVNSRRARTCGQTKT